jgi:hypothetical protein
LDLVVTNAYGTNITVIPLVTLNTVSTNPPPHITFAVTNAVLYLSWPSTNTGFQLQAQTNTVNKGISANWVNYTPAVGLPSIQTNKVVIPVNLTNGTVFYRLLYP